MPVFEVLGANATAPTADGPASSYLVSAGEDGGWILVDAGPGGMAQFCHGHDLAELRGIVITHLHADHSLDLMALAYRWTFPTALPRIPVYVPTGGLRILRAFDELFGITTLPGMDRPMERAWDCRELPADGAPRRIGQTDFSAYPAHHAITSNALRFQIGDRTIAFSSDTCRCPGVERAAHGADLFVCECTYLTGDEQQMRTHGHLNAAQAATLADDAGAVRLLLTHFGTPGMQDAARARAAGAFPRQLDIAAPGWRW
jgi:ribonuclease BN (tRNA processing enzyme)